MRPLTEAERRELQAITKASSERVESMTFGAGLFYGRQLRAAKVEEAHANRTLLVEELLTIPDQLPGRPWEPLLADEPATSWE